MQTHQDLLLKVETCILKGPVVFLHGTNFAGKFARKAF